MGAVLTVAQAPWPDVPRGPFVIDLFVLESHRGHGLGESLMRAAMAGAPGDTIGLRVEDDNAAALSLYAKLGFARPAVPPHAEGPASVDARRPRP